jgi:UDP-N-acetyl-D-glucosamine dehydrogenase
VSISTATSLAPDRTVTVAAQLAEKIESRTARVGVIGLGYVGLPLSVEFARAEFSVTGIDVSSQRVEILNSGRSYIPDVSDVAVASFKKSGHFTAVSDFSVIRTLDTLNICVPTPLRKTKDPDMSYIMSACEQVAAHLHPGMLIVLESTTYPGTTEEVVQTILETSGLHAGREFFLCFSPERVDPGNPAFQTRNIPKVIGGITPDCTRLGALLYSQALERVVPVSSTRVAEMVKLLENTFRMINIGLVNELAMMCNRMDIDVWEVIDAAATKPFGFMAFYPGPGLGGHCIPVDPFYLSWKSKQSGIEARFIELAGYINGQMPEYVVDRVQDALNERRTPLFGSRIHVIGVAYKRDSDDSRESPAFDIIHLLRKRGAEVSYTDPHISEVTIDGTVFRSAALAASIRQADCAVIVTDHSNFDYELIAREAKLVFDARNALKGARGEKVVRL